MNFLRQWGQFMMMGAKAHARWEIGVSDTIFRDKKRLVERIVENDLKFIEECDVIVAIWNKW